MIVIFWLIHQHKATGVKITTEAIIELAICRPNVIH